MMYIFFITAFLLTGYILLLCMYRRGWKKMIPYHNLTTEPVTYISVIVPARNEEKNIGRLLDGLMAQTYPKDLFEVLIIDDHSSDTTEQVVGAYLQSNIRLLKLADYVNENKIVAHKKKAIEIGIKNAKGILIVTTDADCMVEPDWLKTIAGFYEQEKPEMMVMPVDISPAKTGIQIFQALDFMSLQGITAASVSQNWHGMCNGANLAYSRKAFEAVGGFENIDHLASGDDMLLMHKISGHFPKKIKYLFSEKTIVRTLPVESVGDFLQQRIRWASKSNQYQDKTILPVLMMVYLLNLFLLLMPVSSWFQQADIDFELFTLSMTKCWIILMLIKIIFECYFLIPVAGFFKKTQLLLLFPFMQPFHLIYTIIAGSFGYLGSYQWKGRTNK